MTEKQLIRAFKSVYNKSIRGVFSPSNFLISTINNYISYNNNLFREAYKLSDLINIFKINEIFDLRRNIGSKFDRSCMKVDLRCKINSYEILYTIKTAERFSMHRYFNQDISIKFGSPFLAREYKLKELINSIDNINDDSLIELQYKLISNMVDYIYQELRDYMINLFSTNIPDIKIKTVKFEKITSFGDTQDMINLDLTYQPFVLIDTVRLVNMLTGDIRARYEQSFKDKISDRSESVKRSASDDVTSLLYFPLLNKILFHSRLAPIQVTNNSVSKNVYMFDINKDKMFTSEILDYKDLFFNTYMPQDIHIGNIFNNLVISIITEDNFTYAITFNKYGESPKSLNNIFSLESVNNFTKRNASKTASIDLIDRQDKLLTTINSIIHKSYVEDMTPKLNTFKEHMEDLHLNTIFKVGASINKYCIPFIDVDIAYSDMSILINEAMYRRSILERLNKILNNDKSLTLSKVDFMSAIRFNLTSRIIVPIDNKNMKFKDKYDALCNIYRQSKHYDMFEALNNLRKKFYMDDFYCYEFLNIETFNDEILSDPLVNSYKHYKYNSSNNYKVSLEKIIQNYHSKLSEYLSYTNDIPVNRTTLPTEAEYILGHMIFKYIHKPFNNIVKSFINSITNLEDLNLFPNLKDIKKVYTEYHNIPKEIKSSINERFLDPKLIGFNSNTVQDALSGITLVDPTESFNIKRKNVIEYQL